MTKQATCGWCLLKVKASDAYDSHKHTVYCSKGCHDADALFRAYYSDEEINRREHYRELTRGEGE